MHFQMPVEIILETENKHNTKQPTNSTILCSQDLSFCIIRRLFMENITWLRENKKFISSVEANKRESLSCSSCST